MSVPRPVPLLTLLALLGLAQVRDTHAAAAAYAPPPRAAAYHRACRSAIGAPPPQPNWHRQLAGARSCSRSATCCRSASHLLLQAAPTKLLRSNGTHVLLPSGKPWRGIGVNVMDDYK